jgi:hypothetical protein
MKNLKDIEFEDSKLSESYEDVSDAGNNYLRNTFEGGIEYFHYNPNEASLTKIKTVEELEQYFGTDTVIVEKKTPPRETTITVGTQINSETKYHMDGRIMRGTFKVLGQTKGGRWKIEITQEFPNGNDYTKPLITHTEKKTVSLQRMLNEQWEFMEHTNRTEIVKSTPADHSDEIAGLKILLKDAKTSAEKGQLQEAITRLQKK